MANPVNTADSTRLVPAAGEPYRWLEVPDDAPAAYLRLSPVLAEAIALTARDGPPAVLVRPQRPYVLLGPQDRRLPRVEQAAATLTARGLPVFMRISGGSAVLLDEHCLSFGAMRACRDLTTLERNFRELAAGALEALRILGVKAAFGAARGSYCEGPWDIVVNGRKVAGISQAIRQGFTLVSGMLLVDQEPVATTAFIQAFYRQAGSDRRFDPEAVTNLSLQLGRPVTREEVRAALRIGYERTLGLAPSAIGDAEWQRAEVLHSQRRFPATAAG